MRVLAVLAHPTADSFNHAIAATAVTSLRNSGHHVDLIDLYALDYNAVMSPAERVAYDTDEPILDPVVRHHADLVKAAEVLLFIYPTWWSGLPAILKGWMERTLVPGVAFVFENGKVKRGLRHTKRVVGISTYASSHRTVALVNDNGRRVLLRALRLCTGIRTRATWLGCYGIGAMSAADRTAFLRRIERRMASL